LHRLGVYLPKSRTVTPDFSTRVRFQSIPKILPGPFSLEARGELTISRLTLVGVAGDGLGLARLQAGDECLGFQAGEAELVCEALLVGALLGDVAQVAHQLRHQLRSVVGPVGPVDDAQHVVAQRLAQFADGHAKAIVELNLGVFRPGVRLNFFAGYNRTRSFKQKCEQLERLILKRHRVSVTPQCAVVEIGFKVRKTIHCRHRWSPQTPSKPQECGLDAGSVAQESLGKFAVTISIGRK